MRSSSGLYYESHLHNDLSWLSLPAVGTAVEVDTEICLEKCGARWCVTRCGVRKRAGGVREKAGSVGLRDCGFTPKKKTRICRHYLEIVPEVSHGVMFISNHKSFLFTIL